MEIKPHEITIRELVDGYFDDGEEGVYGYGENLNIRPPYQREFVYEKKEQAAVINSIIKGYPINIMYWMDNGNGTYELLDGQQRTLSICRYVDGEFPVEAEGSTKFFDNLTPETKEKILDYKLTVYFCTGTTEERLEWFQTINIAGKTLTDQEVRNAIYNGEWVTAAKRIFSKTGCYAYNLGGSYVSGDYLRQEVFEIVLKWACDKDGIRTVQEYMAIHQNDSGASELKDYFTAVIEWIEMVFPVYHTKMKNLQWGLLYNKYHKRKYDGKRMAVRMKELIDDWEVTSKPGVFEYLLGGELDKKLLSLRQFDEQTKRRQYAIQKGVCPMCGEHFEYEQMHGDHIKPWSKGGQTIPENCQMLCTACNLKKSAQEAKF